MACRNLESAEGAKINIVEKNKIANVELAKLDLLDTQSIKHFAEKISKSGEKIDVLINNAAIACPMTSKSIE